MYMFYIYFTIKNQNQSIFSRTKSSGNHFEIH